MAGYVLETAAITSSPPPSILIPHNHRTYQSIAHFPTPNQVLPSTMSTISQEKTSRGIGVDITTDDKWKFFGACE
jgi:hypothetical protein